MEEKHEKLASDTLDIFKQIGMLLVWSFSIMLSAVIGWYLYAVFPMAGHGEEVLKLSTFVIGMIVAAGVMGFAGSMGVRLDPLPWSRMFNCCLPTVMVPRIIVYALNDSTKDYFNQQIYAFSENGLDSRSVIFIVVVVVHLSVWWLISDLFMWTITSFIDWYKRKRNPVKLIVEKIV